ncbi:MAG: hypothetical protein HOE48_11095 [Candidatus Latescibacteria bacterium]|nr:hypothetical protein [Candidatus Latescibacterota bacterium]MBT4138454.1 hypothetical protein [Candidatus Latescibacterota bacterium]
MASIGDLRDASADMLLAWARQAVPHYGASGSMDLDLPGFPDAEGPTYYNQFAHYALLLLSEGVVPGAGDDERTQFREAALGNIRYILSMTDTEFHTPHFSRGRDWGRHVGEWLNIYLLRSLHVMEAHDVGDADLRDEIAKSVQGAVAILVSRFQSRFDDAPVQFPGNHATWHGLLFYEAGQYFDQVDWMDFAKAFFAKYIIPTQRPNGVWPEGDGIVVNYSLVTTQAVSLFAEASGDSLALESMARALGFFKYFSLPDGSSGVAGDCRMRYHARPMVFLPPSFLRSDSGRQLWLDRVNGYRQSLDESELVDNAAQGLAFYGASVQALFEWHVADDTLLEVIPEDVPVGRIDLDAWTGFLSWQLTPEHASRFILDAQNFVEIYHSESGYLVGAGNSKYMPRFSTVRRIDSGRSYIPDFAECVEQSDTEVVSVYVFGTDQVQVSLSVEDNKCCVRARLLTEGADADYEFGLMLAFKKDEIIQLGDTSLDVLPLAMINHRFGDEGLVWRERSFDVPTGAVLDYPLIPHNPYTQHGLPTEEAYIARLSFRVSEEEKTVVIS